MGKVLKIGLIVGAVALAFVPGAQGVLAGVLSGVGAGGGVTAFGFAAAGVVAGAVSSLGLALGLGMASKALGLGPKTPKINQATADRLRADIVPTTPRKQIFGETALATDIRYQGFTGGEQEYLHQIVCVASHKVDAITELWLEDKLAWTAAGGVQSGYTGYLTVTPVLEGSAANVVDIDAKWGSTTNRRLTGCAYLHLRFKLTGNSKKTSSPFANGVSPRYTIKGRGRMVYDPRRDSTAGGSGSMRIDDQATWAFSVSGDPVGRNPALALLNWLLGWRINGKLAVGKGVPPSRIDLTSFITAANLCDESVALAAGGTERRYRFDGITDEGQGGGSDIANFCGSMNAVLRDAGGRLAVSVLHNDLAAPVCHFTTDDVIGAFEWVQTQSLTTHRNIVRGRYVDPSSNALFQLVDYPEAAIESPDGIDRIDGLDLPAVQSASQAQRLAKQRLQRIQYGGTFSAPFNARGWIVQPGDVVAFDFTPLGFTGKLFRVAERTMRFDGVCELAMREEHPDIYAWDASEAPAVNPAAPTVYDWQNNPLIAQLAGIADGATRNVDRGPWASGTAYVAGDEVQDQGSSWGAKIDHVATSGNGPPALPTTENATWRLRARAGADGAPGLDGDDGLPGAPGADGETSYVHFAYANNATGTLDFTTGAPGGRYYVGVYTDFTAADSTTPGDYTWSLQRGADGANGTPGAPGADGSATFVHIAYATAADGSTGFSTTDGAGKTYIGTYTDGTLADSSDPADYTWSLIKGDTGAPGLTISPASGITVACFNNGNPRSGELPKSFSVQVFAGNTDVTSSCTFALTNTDCGVTSDGAGGFSLTSITADQAQSSIVITYGSVSATQVWQFKKSKDGSSATSASQNVSTLPSSTSYAVAASVDLAVNAGATINGNFAVSYKPANVVTSSGSYELAGYLTLQNITDSGTESTVDGPTVGSLAENFPSDVSYNEGFLSLNGGGSNAAGTVKVFRLQLYLKKNSGIGNGTIVSGPAQLQMQGG